MAFNNPFPLIFSTILLPLMYDWSFSLKIIPILPAFSANFSSLITFNAAMATSQATGLPPKVDPCSPGLIVSITSSDANIAETGNTPPDKAFPKINISGLNP